MRVLLYRPNSWYTKLIAWRTRSEYCHVSVRVGNTIFESDWCTGVTHRDANQRDNDAISINIDVGRHGHDWLYAQCGTGYGYFDIFCLALGLPFKTKAMTCGEFVAKLLKSYTHYKLPLRADYYTPAEIAKVLLS